MKSVFKWEKGSAPPCKKCRFPLVPTKDMSVSTKTHKYGRQGRGALDDTASASFEGSEFSYGEAASAPAPFTFGGRTGVLVGEGSSVAVSSEKDETLN
jgi:hypothetical protein